MLKCFIGTLNCDNSTYELLHMTDVYCLVKNHYKAKYCSTIFIRYMFQEHRSFLCIDCAEYHCEIHLQDISQ